MADIFKIRNAIELTNLKPDASLIDIQNLCAQAMQQHFAAVCISPYFISDAIQFLGDSTIEIVTVVGFPFGYNSTIAKFEEVEEALALGVHHIDVVCNIAAIKNNDWETVENEIETLTKLIHAENRVIKIIAETGLLNEVEIELLCKIANDYKVDYVKTYNDQYKFLGSTLDPVF